MLGSSQPVAVIAAPSVGPDPALVAAKEGARPGLYGLGRGPLRPRYNRNPRRGLALHHSSWQDFKIVPAIPATGRLQAVKAWADTQTDG
jgi:hypothetical protein